MVYDTAPLGTGKNWVSERGGLPPFVRAVAHALIRHGHTESEAIQIAIGVMKRAIASGKWASLKGHASGKTLAKSGSSIAHWEAMKAGAHLSGSDAVSIDLAYQWKHGWIPLTPAALAIKLGKSHGHADGIKANDARKALGTHKDFRAGFEKGRADVKGHSYSPGDLRSLAQKHEAASTAHLAHADDRFYPGAISDATKEAGHAAALRHEAMLSQRRFHHTQANLSGGNVTTTVDLSQMLPDMDAVRKAASKLSKLPPPLRKAMAARLVARAKQLGVTLNLSGPAAAAVIDLSVDQATRDAAKSAGLTFPGTDSYPLAGPDGKFSTAMAKKAVAMVGLGNVGSKAAIQKWLMAKLKANGAADLIPDSWSMS